MQISRQQSKILFISTFPPRKCGIASFTQDLVNAIEEENRGNFSVKVCALDKTINTSAYGDPVTMIMDGCALNSCIETANRINKDSSIKLVWIEHEFGLYGGEMGEYIVGFLALLDKPFFIRFHTVLPAPDTKRMKMVQQISMLADKVVVMTNNSAKLLNEDYHVSTNKIIIIPHGTHHNSNIGVSVLKHKYKLDNKLVLTSFGLLSPNKGIEKGIMAMKEISEKFPHAMYIVLGHTHPNLLAQEGEKYRNYLQQIIAEHQLEDNVRLVNEYVPTEKLMEYLTLTDLYLFTSKDPNQAVSGTFLYAMSAGCPIISNSFVLAKEMLDETTGIILETTTEQELAGKAILLLENDELRKQMGKNAFLKTRDTTWKRVSHKHIGLFNEFFGKPILSAALSNGIIN